MFQMNKQVRSKIEPTVIDEDDGDENEDDDGWMGDQKHSQKGQWPCDKIGTWDSGKAVVGKIATDKQT